LLRSDAEWRKRGPTDLVVCHIHVPDEDHRLQLVELDHPLPDQPVPHLPLREIHQTGTAVRDVDVDEVVVLELRLDVPGRLVELLK
jgi:hypothetical protein